MKALTKINKYKCQISLKLTKNTFKKHRLPLRSLSHFLPFLEISKNQRKQHKNTATCTHVASKTEVWEPKISIVGKNAVQSDSAGQLTHTLTGQ